jgi:tetratricopeptide (TPR) repeat protein
MHRLRALVVAIGWTLAATVMAASAQNMPPGIAPHERSYEQWNKARNGAEGLTPDLRSLQLYQDAIDIAEKVTKEDPSNTAWQQLLGDSYSRMGWALERAEQPEHALNFYGAALKVTERLAGAEARVGPMRRELIALKLEVGRIHLEQQRIAEALPPISEARALARAAVEAAPDDTENQRALMKAYSWMAALQAKQGDFTAAVVSRRDEIAIAERLAKAMPGDRDRAKALADSYEALGSTLNAAGSEVEALDILRQALVIRRQLVQARPDDDPIRVALARTYGEIGRIRLRQGDWQPSLEAFSESLDVLRGGAALQPGNNMWDEMQAYTRGYVGIVLGKLGRRAEARENLLKAREAISSLRALYPGFKQRWDEYAWIDRELENLK